MKRIPKGYRSIVILECIIQKTLSGYQLKVITKNNCSSSNHKKTKTYFFPNPTSSFTESFLDACDMSRLWNYNEHICTRIYAKISNQQIKGFVLNKNFLGIVNYQYNATDIIQKKY